MKPASAIDVEQTQPGTPPEAGGSSTPRSNFRLELISAYAAAGARIASWVVVSALVYRRSGEAAFAMLALVRTTLGLLNYTTVGLAPAMIHFLPKASGRAGTTVANRLTPPDIYSNGLALAWGAAGLGVLALWGYVQWFTRTHVAISPDQAALPLFLSSMGLGTILRLASDPPGAALQVGGKIALDNILLALAEAVWVAASTLSGLRLPGIGVAFLISSATLLVARVALAYPLTHQIIPAWRLVQRQVAFSLLSYGLLVSLAQVADFLYAPTDYILIDRLLSPRDLAAYAPAVQLDAGLFLLVGAIANLLLPKAALAHAQQDQRLLRRYYLRGTLASLVLLVIGSLATLALAPWLLRLWLGNAMPATQAILPLVLINTVVGGSSAVGRSILLGAGRVRAFTLSVLIAGATNVVCSYLLVRYAHLGLPGIIAGTLIAVLGRCGVWMPWYVWHVLAEGTKGRRDVGTKGNAEEGSDG